MSHCKVPHTCPDIDKLVDSIRSSLKSLKLAYTEEDSAANDHIWNAESELKGLEDLLEDIRTANTELRSFGEEKAEECERLESEIEVLQAQLNLFSHD